MRRDEAEGAALGAGAGGEGVALGAGVGGGASFGGMAGRGLALDPGLAPVGGPGLRSAPPTVLGAPRGGGAVAAGSLDALATGAAPRGAVAAGSTDAGAARVSSRGANTKEKATVAAAASPTATGHGTLRPPPRPAIASMSLPCTVSVPSTAGALAAE